MIPHVTVEGKKIGEINHGLIVLLGVDNKVKQGDLASGPSFAITLGSVTITSTSRIRIMYCIKKLSD